MLKKLGGQRELKIALLAFTLSSVAMALSVLLLFLATGGEQKDETQIPFSPCGFEPYSQSNEALAAMDSLETEPGLQLSTELLAAAIDAVAGDESYVIRVAFGAVMINRVRSAGFPSTLAAVLRSIGISAIGEESEISERSRRAARDALLGTDPTFGSLYIIKSSDPAYAEYSDKALAIYGSYAFIR